MCVCIPICKAVILKQECVIINPMLPSKQAVIGAILITGLIFTATPLVGTAVAQGCDTSSPGAMAENCDDPSINPFTGMLENIYDIGYGSLLYLGFVGVFAGATLYLSIEKNKERAQNGLWFFFGGIALIILYFAASIVSSVMTYIAIGSA